MQRFRAWWTKDIVILDEPVGPRWWYLIIAIAVLLGEWWARVAGG